MIVSSMNVYCLIQVAVDFTAGGDPAAAAIEAARLLAAESDKVLEVTRAFTSTNLKTSH